MLRWLKKQYAGVAVEEKETGAGAACYLYLMPSLPTDLKKFRSDYIWVRDHKRLYYIKPDGRSEDVFLAEFKTFSDGLDHRFHAGKSEKIALSEEQIEKLIRSNGGHLRIKMTEDLIKRAASGDAEAMRKFVNDSLCNRSCDHMLVVFLCTQLSCNANERVGNRLFAADNVRNGFRLESASGRAVTLTEVELLAQCQDFVTQPGGIPSISIIGARVTHEIMYFLAQTRKLQHGMIASIADVKAILEAYVAVSRRAFGEHSPVSEADVERLIAARMVLEVKHSSTATAAAGMAAGGGIDARRLLTAASAVALAPLPPATIPVKRAAVPLLSPPPLSFDHSTSPAKKP